MASSLVFVLAPKAALPAEQADWNSLQEAQLQAIGSGAVIRIFRVPASADADLDELVRSGLANVAGVDPFQTKSSERHLICDALVPQLEPRTLWLGVYELSGSPRAGTGNHPAQLLEISSCRCLDQFPLREADNETCWFYPTENGRYLCWENQRQLQTTPGYLPDMPPQDEPLTYARHEVHVLWSLMADDQALTCVGLTYRGKRIDWSSRAIELEPWATWSSFEVDTMAEDTYKESSRITVFASDQDA